MQRAGLLLTGLLVGCAPWTDQLASGGDTGFGQPVLLRHESGIMLGARFEPGRAGAGALLILHGMGGDHRDMVPRGRALARLGYSVLLLDFRGHGTSAGSGLTYGFRESEDVRLALTWLRGARPGEPVGVIGVSMGGAAALLGREPLEVDALVLESVYPTIGAAVRNRLRHWLGPVGVLAAPLIERTVTAARGISRAALRPIDRVGELPYPVLVAAGSRDPYTPIEESRALYERTRAGTRLFWEVAGAGHADLFSFDPAEYLRVVGGFLSVALRSPSSAGLPAVRR